MSDAHLGHEHVCRAYDEEFRRLIDEIVRMGQLAIEQLRGAVQALATRDSALAEKIKAADAAIDTLDQDVGHDALRMLALRQPIARDLREILAALRISAAIERIGDYAANVAKRSIVLSAQPAVAPAADLPQLAELAIELLLDVLAAYRERDADRAKRVWARDAELDERYTALFQQLLDCMMRHPQQITACTHLLFVAKNIERIGDHATNIAENVWFAVHGWPLAQTRLKRDATSEVVAAE